MPVNSAMQKAAVLYAKAALIHTNLSRTKLHAIFVAVLFSFLCNWQAYAQPHRAINHFEVFLGAGVSHFSGDIGGSDKPLGVDMRTLGYNFGAGARYYITNRWALRAVINFGKLKGVDSLSGNTYRMNRNLDFKSNIVDFSAAVEFSILNWGVVNFKRKKGGYLTKRHNLYVFGGLSVFHFHPYGSLNDEWYSLPELSTAGQGLQGGPSAYKLYSFSIPVGAGYKFQIQDGISIGLELTFRKTFTDYIDDVSAPYYDNMLLNQQKGIIAASIADKNRFPGGAKRPKGAARGNPGSNDNFTFLTITFSKQLGKSWVSQKTPCNIF